MRKIFFILFLCVSIFKLEAQTELDSLWSVWKDITKTDSIRAIALEDYIYKGYFYSQPDSAIVLADVLYKFNQKTGNQKGMVNALQLSGYTFFRMGNYPKALNSYKRGLKIANDISYKRGKASIFLKTGYIYHDNGDIVMALNYYEKSLKIYKEIDDKIGMGSIYNEYGSIYLLKKEYAKSLEYYLKTMAINKELNDENGNSAIYTNLGQLYLNQKDFNKAIENFNKGLNIDKRIGDKLGIANDLAGIGNVYSEQGNFEKALKYLLKSLKISNQIDDIQGSAATLLSLGDIYYNQKKYFKSIKNCQKSLKLGKSLGDISTQKTSCDCLYLAYKAMGNMNEALIQHEQMLLFTDSLKTEESTKKLQQMEFTKQVLADSLLQVEKDIKLEMAHKIEVNQKDKNRNLAIGVGIFFLLLSIGFFSRWRYVKKSKSIIEKEKERSDNLLLNILPAEIAEELKEKGEAISRDFDLVTILFTDFKGFTEKSEKLTAKELIGEINDCFMAFDNICEKHGIEKIKTIGDSYMAAGGLPVLSDDSVQNTILAALEMQSFITERITIKKAKNEIPFEMRLGIHTGPVVAGIVGVKKFQYDIWGDTVNTASRMESAGEIGKVNISQHTYELIKDNAQFTFESRGKIHVKGKNEIEMWFVGKNKNS